MSKYTLTIKDNETQETVKELEFNALFAGFADDENNGRITLIQANGMQILLAMRNTQREIEKYKKENPEVAFLAMMMDVMGENKTENEGSDDNE